MYSEGSSSDSDVSYSSGDMCFESDTSLHRYRRRSRRESISSVSTHPSVEAYVMVLQNRQCMFDTETYYTSLKDMPDITFLAGIEKKPVFGVRAIISTKCRLLYQLIMSFEKNIKSTKGAKKSHLRKTVAKLNKFNCVMSGRKHSDNTSVKNNVTIPMETYDPETFQRLMNYVHSGTLTVDASTVIGLLNAAYMFDFPEVQQACWDFAMGCMVRRDNLHDMIRCAGRYADHRMTVELVNTMRKYTIDYPELVAYSQIMSQLANQVYQSDTPDVTAGAT